MRKSPTRMMLMCTAAFLLAAGSPAMGDYGAAELRLDATDEESLEALLESSPAERALDIARSLLGTPYAPGGSLPGGFDCSGLVQYVYRQIGIDLPRTSREQYSRVSRISPEELQPGDLLFFRISKNRISHVGIYVEEGRFIHAPSRGKKVSYDSLGDPYWRTRLAGAGRLFHSATPFAFDRSRGIIASNGKFFEKDAERTLFDDTRKKAHQRIEKRTTPFDPLFEERSASPFEKASALRGLT